MTMPDERTRAIMQTREFLQTLTRHGDEAVRHEALRLLRHYPCAGDIRLAHEALPIWFGPVSDDFLPKRASQNQAPREDL